MLVRNLNTFAIDFAFFVVPCNIFVNIVLDLQFLLYLTNPLIDPDKKVDEMFIWFTS